MTGLVLRRPTTDARVYAGNWIADCPICRSAAVRRFGDPVWECRDCGTNVEVNWPAEHVRRGVERLLMLRPLQHTRNWFPHETLHDLLAENVAHAVVGPAEEGQHMMIVGDRIELDTLPKPQRRLQIGA
jgi:ribosomal protein L37AE/L43A